MIPRGSAPHAAPLATLHCDSPHKVQCLPLVPTQNPHVAESLGGRGSDCAGQIPAAAATDSRFRVTLDQNLSRWDPCHWLLRACCAFQRSQRALAVLAMLHAGSETNCWRWDGSVVVKRLSRLWWANNPPLVADSRDRHTRDRARPPPRVRTLRPRHRAANVGCLGVSLAQPLVTVLEVARAGRASAPCRGLTSHGRARHCIGIVSILHLTVCPIYLYTVPISTILASSQSCKQSINRYGSDTK